MSQAEIFIEPATAAATHEFFVGGGEIVPLAASGLSAGESIAVECMTPSGFVQYVSNGVNVALSPSTNKLGVDIPGRYRLNKGVTVTAAGVLRDAS